MKIEAVACVCIISYGGCAFAPKKVGGFSMKGHVLDDSSDEHLLEEHGGVKEIYSNAEFAESSAAHV